MEIFLVALWAFLATVLQYWFGRWKDHQRRKVILLALEKELRAVAFTLLSIVPAAPVARGPKQ